jgi:hypothetical protein
MRGRGGSEPNAGHAEKNNAATITAASRFKGFGAIILVWPPNAALAQAHS